MRFILAIDLGNDAMKTQGDIGDALRVLGTDLYNVGRGDRYPVVGDSGPIRDVNGNRVGSWHVEANT